MKFPKWVSQGASTKEQKAANRLRYIVGRLALEFSKEGTLKALCTKLNVSHSTVSIYVSQGRFSESMALRFEKAFGAEFASSEWLMDPMTLKADAK